MSALPIWMYRNPEDVAIAAELDALGCRACRHASVYWGAVNCDDERNEKQHGVPGIGHRCKWFSERG